MVYRPGAFPCRKAAAASAPSAKPEEFLPYIRARLAAFVQGAPQTDDITMLGVQFNGSEKSK